MKLYKYEMKKLIFNKARVILLASLFLLYGFLAFVLSGDLERKITPEYSTTKATLEKLYEANIGSFNQEKFDESKEIVTEAEKKYGRGSELEAQLRTNTTLIFAQRYLNFGNTVNFYWNGPTVKTPDHVLGIYPLQEKLKMLELFGNTDSYEYKYYSKRLSIELKMGEPTFEHTGLWSLFFVMFDGMFIVLLLLMALTFLIAPLFTQEVRTDMDSIILCSVKGRREIVTAKLFAAISSSAILALTYLLSSFLGMCIGNGDFRGFSAHVRSLELFTQTQLDITAGAMFLLSSVWLILATVVFGLVLALISCKIKTQSGAFGIGIVVLLAGMMSGALPNSVYRVLWPFVDFNFGSLAMFNTIFGGTKAYNVLGSPVFYGGVAFFVGIGIGIVSCLLIYLAQRKRTVV